MTVSVDMGRLQMAAVAMLEPLMRSGDERDVSGELSEAIDLCARAAREQDVRSIGYLSAIVVPYLRKGGLSTRDAPGRELIETWLNELFAFCAGQLPPDRVRALVDQLVLWPRLPRLPDEFADMIVERLQRDAQVLARESQEAPESGASEEAGEATHPVKGSDAAAERLPDLVHAGRSVPALPLLRHAQVIDIARDELDLLVAETTAIEERLLPALLALTTSDAGEAGPVALDARRDLLTELSFELSQIGAALEAIGHVRLQTALDRVAAELRQAAGQAGGIADRHHRSLIELPLSLRSYFEDPGQATARALLSALSPWLDGADAELERALAGVRVIASRQVARRDLADDPDENTYRLRVPDDTDPSVLVQLKRELPRLCEEFALAIDDIRAGQTGRLADAQRIAHTLKGSANTAGIRAIALLTHELEDVLQLLQAAAAPAEPELCDWLERASEALFDLSEALAGRAQAPADLREVHAALMQWVNRLLSGRTDNAGKEDREHAADVVDTAGAAGQVSELPDTLPVMPADAPEQGAEWPDESAAGLHISAADDQARAAGVPEADTATVDSTVAEREVLQVPAGLIERMLDTISEASIKLAQMQEHITQVDSTRLSLRNANEGLQSLSGELERLVDVRGVAVTARSGSQEFDPLELDEYNDLHTVSRRIAEAGADQRVIDRSLDRHLLELKALSDEVERLQVDLQDLAHRTRMIAVRTIAPRLRRAVRQAARMAGKAVELVVQGEQTELDGEILDLLVDSLAHLLRNAVDHGIEDASTRLAMGKPQAGQVTLRFSRDAALIRIECSDDGAGIDRDAVIARARAQGLLAADEAVGADTWSRLILAPGLSTRQEVTQLSGRGIGLDVVNQAIRRLRGRLSVASEAGQGSRFLIEIPVKVSSRPVMIIDDARYCLAVTAQSIEEILSARALSTDTQGRQVALTAHGPLPVRLLSDLLGLPAQVFAAEQADSMLLVVRHGDDRLAILTPALTQARNVMVRSLPAWVPCGAGVAGLAVLGEGSVAPVLDLQPLLDSPGDPATSYSHDVSFENNQQPLCLVVDDSVSVRRSMELFLQDIGLRVMTAADGLQALDRARRHCPALVIVDLEMPRMNGIEFAKAFRADAQFAGIPIIMITSRFSQKHRKRALEAGVSVFMTKPYTEDAVASEIQRCLLRKFA